MACSSPLYRLIKGNWAPVPCGRCPPCKKRRVDGWVFRLLQEDKVSTSAHFVTLTYEPKFVPISPNGFMTLDKDAFPLYMKRLRKLTTNKLKYYACGEYGTKNKRPHYHAIIFNVPDAEMFYEAWKKDGQHFGQVVVGEVTGNSIAYTMKYIDKGPNVEGLFKGWKPFVGRDDRLKEFALMSKGMGLSYCTDRIKRYHKDDLSRTYITVDGGYKIAMPRYYKDKIYTDDEKAELGTLAEIAAGKAESENYARYLKHHSSGDLDYQQFKDGQRSAVLNRFLSQQKKQRDV